jgi:hypothetical protein
MQKHHCLINLDNTRIKKTKTHSGNRETRQRYLDVVVRVQCKAVIHSCRQNNHAPFLHCYADPLIILVPHVEVAFKTHKKIS